jgi:hypothetical protein
MKYIIAAASALLLAGPVLAQGVEGNQPQAPSTVDKGAAPTAGSDAAAPKTTGAMNKTTDSVATSPQDVGAQQKGDKTAAEGGGHRPGAPAPDPNQRGEKTTGAAPGAQ